MYQPRVYRHELEADLGALQRFELHAGESDLLVIASRPMEREALEALLKARDEVQSAIERDSKFAQSLAPLPPVPFAPPTVRRMIHAAEQSGTGPMAAVAGSIAQSVGERLAQDCAVVIVENGGDLYLAADCELSVGVFAGGSTLSGKIGLKIEASRLPAGVATSSASVGHSLSQGATDAACVVADDAALADACATALGNMVGDAGEVDAALHKIVGLEGVRGALVIINDKIGALGEIELTHLQGE
ncbi:MAG: UPF0280 family protein [Candidatus Alcyoniella australis]|nr:UPF0280 family protein [Candidatus Alcyoniella australis]